MDSSREMRTPEDRVAAQYAALRDLLEHARNAAPGWARLLPGLDGESIVGPEQLATLPVLRKSTLTEMQSVAPPFGELVTLPLGQVHGVCQV